MFEVNELKLGRKPPIPGRASLKLSSFLSAIPYHSPVADHLSIGGWKMLGNDQYGDCVAVTRSDFIRVMTRLAGHERYPDLTETLEFYKTQNPDFPRQDEGMVIQYALEEMLRRGEILAFAKVDHSNSEEVAAAIDIFGALWVGINVQAANMDQFNLGRQWDYTPGSPDDGGHSILYGGYNTDRNMPERCKTWGRVQDSTDAFWQHQVEEAWIVVFPENLGTAQFQQGIDIKALKKAYSALTDKDLILPEPAPVPTPTPDPGAASFPGADSEVDRRVLNAAHRAGLTPSGWLNKNLKKYFRIKS
jgi:hypothetical protein